MSIEQITPISSTDTSAITEEQAAVARNAETSQAHKEAEKTARAAKYAAIDAAALYQTNKEAAKEALAAKYAKADAAALFQTNEDADKAATAADSLKADTAEYQANKDLLENTLAAKTDPAVASQRAAGSSASPPEVISKDDQNQAIEAYQANSVADTGAAAAVAQAAKPAPHINILD